MFHCPVGVWVIEQRAIISNATVRSPTVSMDIYNHMSNTLWGEITHPFLNFNGEKRSSLGMDK